MLKAIWPSVANVPNHLSASSNITTVGMMCYFLYWLIQFPLMFISPQNIRHLFTVKGVVVPIAWLAILIWSFVKVPASTSLGPLHSTISGSTFSWAWLSALNSALGIYATLAVNIPDFTVSLDLNLRNRQLTFFNSAMQRTRKRKCAIFVDVDL